MPVFIAFGLFGDVFTEGLLQVHIALVGQAKQYPEHVGHFIAYLVLVLLVLKTLVTVFAGHQTGQLAHFFHEYGRIGEFREVPDPDRSYPVVNLFLRAFETDAFHINTYFCPSNHGILNRTSLIQAIRSKKSFLCVGLDTDIRKLPAGIEKSPAGMIAFNKAIIEATHEFAVSYKVNTAFYETLGAKGWEVMEKTLEAIPENIFTIADAKRGDIGNTSAMYARAFFETLAFDSITVNPYMGFDSVSPFLDFEGKWSILLALTSNPGSQDFQTLDTGNSKVYEEVLKKSATWGNPSNTMYVVGATRADELSRIRQIIPEHFLLVPGVGAQGGSLEEVVKHGANKDIGLLINASRSIIYASEGSDFAERAHSEARKMQQDMRNFCG